MPIFKLIEELDAKPEVQETYAKVKARYGGAIPAVYKAFANDPAYLASLNDHIARVMAPRKIDAKAKEIIAFVVASMNGCDFCSHAHAAGLRRFGLDDEAIAEVLGVTALWSEVTRFNIGARVSWPQD
ncbi:carboxymuconolactone decarboxylase family protein [bacterium]|nr:MAG: carboxymuconolactone decarboxylase family protein [bacterium]